MIQRTDGALFHFSEDPTIRRFVPHVAATAADDRPLVWAVDAARALDYWFPRLCPRAMAWVTEETTQADHDFVMGPGGHQRVHAVEYRWLEAILRCRLFVYRLPAESFTLIDGDAPHAYVSEIAVEPLGPAQPVGDLLSLHERAGIQLRVLGNLWPWGDVVTTTSLGFSGVRLANARPR